MALSAALNAKVKVILVREGSLLDQEALATIFDRFVQLDSARRGEGAGLGLPIARWIAEARRG